MMFFTRVSVFVSTPLLLLFCPVVSAGNEVVVAGDSVAVDQPRILFGLEDPVNPGVIVGPDFFNDGLLDTGANGLLLAELAYFDFDQGFINPNLYQVAQRPDLSFVQYEELGVAGTSFFDVLDTYHLSFAGGDLVPHEITNTHILGAPDLSIGSFAAVLGMPVMTGRIVHLDLQPVAQMDFIGVGFVDSRPAHTANTYTVDLSMLPPEFPGQQQPGDPLPTFASLPLIDITARNGELSSGGSVLLDTGGQVSILSVAMASDLGINLDPDDPNTDVLGFLEVGGIGGTVEMPLVGIDRLVIPTNEGIDLVFTDLQVGVLDIPGLGGVMGMNVLTSGYGDLIFGGGAPGEYGVFGGLHLDFTGETGVLQFEMNPEYNIVVPEPGSLLAIGFIGMLLRRRGGA